MPVYKSLSQTLLRGQYTLVQFTKTFLTGHDIYMALDRCILDDHCLTGTVFLVFVTVLTVCGGPLTTLLVSPGLALLLAMIDA